jgi:TolB-like protein/AraC-like DNA-binding protein/Tfp pilus assembly protein PilF
MKTQKTRRLAAIMFTDIVGYTALMQQDENAAAAVRELHRKEFQKFHNSLNGQILQYFGDGTLSIFKSGVEAVKCAIGIQKSLNRKDGIPLRIGIHIGDIVSDGTEIYGDGVNLASRIESMGTAGSVLISENLNAELKNHLDISTRSMGHYGLKNIANPVEIFSVTNDGVYAPEKSELKGKQKKLSKTLAVLPFVNLSSNKDNEYFSDGMTEEIINALAKIQGLKVTSRTSSFYFKNKNLPIAQIGAELNVSTILEGSIRLSGNMMRITAQLIDVADDFHFWSETFDRSLENIFAVQDEISLLIADKLREHLGHFEIEDRLVDASEVPVEIYKKYLKSRYHLLKMTKPDIETGIRMLDEIIKEQPNFAQAHLGVHLGYTLLGTIGLIPSQEAFANGQLYLDRAIEINENLPECQLHLSYISFLQKWDFPNTYSHLNKSLEIRPTVEYYQSMASTLVAEGKFDAAHNYIDIALQIDPFSGINFHLKGFIFYAEEKFNEALKNFEKSTQLNSDFVVSTLYQGQAFLLMGKIDESLSVFQKLPQDDGGDILKLGGTALVYAAAGDTAKAELGIKKMEALLNTDLMGRALNFLILVNALLERHKEALKYIERGIESRLPMMVYLNVDPILRPLRTNPDFRELIKQILGETTSFGIENKKYKQSLFSEEQLKKYIIQLKQLMSDQKPYLEPELTLRKLAEMLGIQANQLSQLLNKGFDKNFAEFVNSYRLKAFKEKLADPKQQHLTLLALAYDSGFNSKTVFNTFFKKMTGITPKEYWKSAVK